MTGYRPLFAAQLCGNLAPSSLTETNVPQGNSYECKLQMQHARLIERLRPGDPLSRAELEQACDVPSVTKRICELIADGWPIERTRGYTESAHGLRRATFYRLAGPRRQLDLSSAARIVAVAHSWAESARSLLRSVFHRLTGARRRCDSSGPAPEDRS